jgi:hypothetical protein
MTSFHWAAAVISDTQIQLPIILFQLYVLIVVTSQLYKSSHALTKRQEL